MFSEKYQTYFHENMVIGDYALKSCISTGGYGSVFVCYHLETLEEFAMKIVRELTEAHHYSKYFQCRASQRKKY